MSSRSLNVSRFLAWGATIIGVVLVTGCFWSDVLDHWIFNAKGDFRTDGIFSILSPIFFQINGVLNGGWFEGLPLFFIGLAGLVFIYSRDSSRFAVLRSRPYSTVALVLVVMAHAVIVAVSAQFFFVPAGSQIRPMAWAMFVGIVSCVAFLLVVPVSIVATIKERPRLLGIIGLVGAFTSFPLSPFILHLAAWIKGFELEP
jgi:hypothetical protein